MCQIMRQHLTRSTPAQVVDWTPQNDLLGDPRVRAFVTHGGLNSIYEARPARTLLSSFCQSATQSQALLYSV